MSSSSSWPGLPLYFSSAAPERTTIALTGTRSGCKSARRSIPRPPRRCRGPRRWVQLAHPGFAGLLWLQTFHILKQATSRTKTKEVYFDLQGVVPDSFRVVVGARSPGARRMAAIFADLFLLCSGRYIEIVCFDEKIDPAHKRTYNSGAGGGLGCALANESAAIVENGEGLVAVGDIYPMLAAYMAAARTKTMPHFKKLLDLTVGAKEDVDDGRKRGERLRLVQHRLGVVYQSPSTLPPSRKSRSCTGAP